MEDVIRWTVKVSKETDVSLRSFLAQRGMKKGGLSKFIERAVQKEVFAQTVAEVQARNSKVSVAKIEAEIDDALRQVRAEDVGKGKETKIMARFGHASHPRYQCSPQRITQGRNSAVQAGRRLAGRPLRVGIKRGAD